MKAGVVESRPGPHAFEGVYPSREELGAPRPSGTFSVERQRRQAAFLPTRPDVIVKTGILTRPLRSFICAEPGERHRRIRHRAAEDPE